MKSRIVRIPPPQADRVNLNVEPEGGAWKVTGLELVEEERIDSDGRPKAG